MKIHLFLNNGMVCNRSVGIDSHWHHSVKQGNVTCKHCIKSLEKGIQIKLNLPEGVGRDHNNKRVCKETDQK